jgi:putative glutamine amidotransferase
VIEAIESTMDDWVALGVQFHPEGDRGTRLDICVFEQFMLGISRTRKLQRVA